MSIARRYLNVPVPHLQTPVSEWVERDGVDVFLGLLREVVGGPGAP